MAIHIVLALLVLAAGSQTGQPPVAQPPVTSETGRAPDAPWPPEGVYRPGKGVIMPRVTKEAAPRYPVDAMKAKVTGAVLVEAIVQTDGTVGEVRVKRSLDKKYGLDDEAVASVKKWQFVAGTKDGVAVPVMVEVELTFTLRK